jgi:hypothetical protein
MLQLIPVFPLLPPGKRSLSGNKAFSLVEILIGSLLTLVVFSLVYFLFVSGARQATGGTGKLQSFHRLRIVSEIIKDDLREAVELLDPVSETYKNSMSFRKFLSSPILDEGSLDTSPLTRKVTYEFNPKEKRLIGTYGGRELVNTTMFEEVAFRKFYLADRPFMRLRFRVSRDEPGAERGTVTLYHTIGPRYLASRVSQKFWHRMSPTEPRGE